VELTELSSLLCRATHKNPEKIILYFSEVYTNVYEFCKSGLISGFYSNV
jgi:hypothetical protein